MGFLSLWIQLKKNLGCFSVSMFLKTDFIIFLFWALLGVIKPVRNVRQLCIMKIIKYILLSNNIYPFLSLHKHSSVWVIQHVLKCTCLPLPMTRPHLSAGTAYVTSCRPLLPPMLHSPLPRRPMMPPKPSRSYGKASRWSFSWKSHNGEDIFSDSAAKRRPLNGMQVPEQSGLARWWDALRGGSALAAP